jgi:hypothetical protein
MRWQWSSQSVVKRVRSVKYSVGQRVCSDTAYEFSSAAYGLLKIVDCCGTAFFRFLSTDPSVSNVGVAEDYDSTVELPDRH